MTAPRPINEQERLRALESYRILDTSPEQDFDDLVKIAAETFGTPIALVSFVDGARQWFKARQGLDREETPRDDAFCAHAICQDGPLVVPDATRDSRFADSPLVTAEPDIRFYAGAPMRTREGHALGTVCVIDGEPRPEGDFDDSQREILEALARQAVRLLEHRKVAAELADALARVKVLAPLVPVCAWCQQIRNDEDYWSHVTGYLRDEAGVETTHGICPSCYDKQGTGAKAGGGGDSA